METHNWSVLRPSGHVCLALSETSASAFLHPHPIPGLGCSTGEGKERMREPKMGRRAANHRPDLTRAQHCRSLWSSVPIESVLIPAFPAYGSGSQAPTPSWEDIGSWPWWLLGEGWSHFFGRVAPWWLAQHLCAYGFWIGLSGLSKIKIKRNMKFGGRCLRELLGVEEGRDGHHWNTSCTCVNSNNNKIR